MLGKDFFCGDVDDWSAYSVIYYLFYKLVQNFTFQI